MAVTFREFNILDYNAVMELWKNTEGIGLSQADDPGRISAFLEHNPHLSFIALDGERVVGTVMSGHDSRRGFIYHLAVDPQYRRQHIGKQLVQICLEGLNQAGIEKCHIMVFAANQNGIRFWENLGWKNRTELVLMSRNIP